MANKIKEKVDFAKKVLETAKEEVNNERIEKYKETAKNLLIDIDEAERTVKQLKQQLEDFLEEVNKHN